MAALLTPAPARLARAFCYAPAMHPKRRAVKLTPRQTEVIALIADGLANKEIADRLNLSTHTVNAHVAALLAKLNVANRAAAAARWVS